MKELFVLGWMGIIMGIAAYTAYCWISNNYEKWNENILDYYNIKKFLLAFLITFGLETLHIFNECLLAMQISTNWHEYWFDSIWFDRLSFSIVLDGIITNIPFIIAICKTKINKIKIVVIYLISTVLLELCIISSILILAVIWLCLNIHLNYDRIKINKVLIIGFAVFTATVFSSIIMLLNIFIDNMHYVIYIGIILWTILLMFFINYVDVYKKKMIKRRVFSINRKIRKVIDIGSNFIQNNKTTYKKYNKTVKKMNKILRQKSLYKTFYSHFKEDSDVKHIIELFKELGDFHVSREYALQIKELKSKTSIDLLNKRKKKNFAGEKAVQTVNNYIFQLNNIIDNNYDEIENLYYYKDRREKYGLSDNAIKKRIITNCFFAGVVLIFLIYINIIIK